MGGTGMVGQFLPVCIGAEVEPCRGKEMCFSCGEASLQSSQQSQGEHPSGQPRAFALSDLMDCTGGHVAACTQAVQYPHMSACGAYISVWRSSHTSQTHLFWAVPPSQHSSGRVSPKGPTAFNQLGHEALQMGLSAGWDRRRRVGGGGGAGGGLVIVNIFAPLPPAPYRVSLLGERSWTARAALAGPCSPHAFSSAALANIFHHGSAHSGCFEKSTV